MTAQGGCLCGAVRYEIHGPLVDAGYCHCRLCQKSSGAPVVAWATLAVSGFRYVLGEAAVYQSSVSGQREHCAVCGTQLVFRSAHSPQTLDITLASLDDPAAVPPEYHIWLQSRVSWLHIKDDLPGYEDAGPDIP